MKTETLQKILIAIAWLSLHKQKVTKARVANYTGYSWVTVNKYFEDVLPSKFLLSSSAQYNQKYKKGVNE